MTSVHLILLIQPGAGSIAPDLAKGQHPHIMQHTTVIGKLHQLLSSAQNLLLRPTATHSHKKFRLISKHSSHEDCRHLRHLTRKHISIQIPADYKL